MSPIILGLGAIDAALAAQAAYALRNDRRRPRKRRR